MTVSLIAATSIAVACGRGHEASSSDAAKSAVAATAVPAPAPKVAPCSLVSAAEVGAIVGKSVVSQSNGSGCDYGLDPSVHDRPAAPARGGAKAGSIPDLTSALGQGGDFSKLAGAISDQLQLTLSLARDGMTEEEVRGIYAGTGAAVRGAVQPEQRGLQGVIRPSDELPGVGDWAFATNVASVQMGAGFSSRGRILEARRGPWHLTLSATVSPDPGADALDRKLAAIARTAIAKLPA